MKPFNVAIFLLVVQTLYSATFLLLWSLEGCSPQTPDMLFGANVEQSLADCDCRTDKFVPVCGKNVTIDEDFFDELTILSPCKAGCSGVDVTYSTEEKELFGCPVVSKGIDSRQYINCAVPVETGICGAIECKSKVWIYLGLVCLGTFFSGSFAFEASLDWINLGVNGSPGTVFLLRSVGSERKPYAMSILGTCMKLFGWLPAPIIYAKLFGKIGSRCNWYKTLIQTRYAPWRVHSIIAYSTITLLWDISTLVLMLWLQFYIQ